MGLFDFFKKKKTTNESRDVNKPKINPIPKAVKWFKPDEVGIIAKPKILKNGNFANTWYDLKGNRVFPTSAKRSIAKENGGAYLGLKKYKNSERWELIKPENVDPYISDESFLNKHAMKSKKRNVDAVKRKSNDVKEIFFSFGDDFYQRRYHRPGPETYTISNPTNIFWRAPTHHDVLFHKSDFSSMKASLRNFKVKRFEVQFSKPVSFVYSTGYWPGEERGPYHKFDCPIDDRLTDEENKIKINSFCNTLNDILEVGSLMKYQAKLSESKNKTKNELVKKFDEDKNGIIDITESNDFMKLIEKNKEVILQASKTDNKPYIQLFVKLFNYLGTKEKNIQLFYDYIKSDEIQSKSELDYASKSLEKQIESYRLILFNSLALVQSLCNENVIIFYQIYECFDKLNIWNSNWENEMSKELKGINKELKTLIRKIDSLEANIIEGFAMLNNTISGGFYQLQKDIVKELKAINSTIDYGNLFNAISAYQLYRINKKTK